MADGALLRGVMVHLRVMTGQAKRARGRERRNCRRGMASITGHMRIYRRLVRLHDLRRTMAGGAVPVRRMVIFVAAGAVSGLWSGRKGDRRLMTLYAGNLRVLRMSKVHLASPWCVAKDRHLNCHVLRIGELGPLVTFRALARGGTLMMADLAPTGHLKRQGSSLRTEIVAGEAGEASVAWMGEGVTRRDLDVRPPPGRILLGRGCPLPAGASRCDQAVRRLARGA